jgi:hypothetical protein
MCHILKIRYALCSHCEQEFNRCQSSINNVHKSEERRKMKNLLNKVFSSFSTRKKECHSSTITNCFLAYCSSCMARAEMAKEHQQADRFQKDNVEKRVRNAYISDAEQGKRLQEQAKRTKFQFSLCAVEGRGMRSSERKPAINSGLCCKRGMDKYCVRQEREGKYGRQLSPQNENQAVTDSAACLRSLREERHRVPCIIDVGQAATTEAKEARRGYRWEREPDQVLDLRQLVITDFNDDTRKMVGSLPPTRKFPSPMHKEPGIDWDRWARAPQTHHGRYPTAVDPPTKPLPHPPLRRKRGYIEKYVHDKSRGPVDNMDHRGHQPSTVPPRKSVPQTAHRTKGYEKGDLFSCHCGSSSSSPAYFTLKASAPSA